MECGPPPGDVGQEPDGGWVGYSQFVGVAEPVADGLDADAGVPEAEGPGSAGGMEVMSPPGADAAAR